MVIEVKSGVATEVFPGIKEIRFDQEKGIVSFIYAERNYAHIIEKKIADVIKITEQ